MASCEKGNYIQVWGEMDDNPNSYRLIIDCLLNLPLLIFTDGEEPRDTSAADIAICSILEMDKYFPNPEFKAKAMEMLEALYRTIKPEWKMYW